MITKDQFEKYCADQLGENPDIRYKKRLRWEIDEIISKDKLDYFWDMHEKKTRYAVNQNNLLVCKLLGICEDFKIEEDPSCSYGEMPDIDVDYLSPVRDYLKNEWAPKKFGEEYVCNIGNYTTFGIKSALNDMARVHGESREELLPLTKNLDAKDDEGKPLTWDAAMKLYPELRKYCDEHPLVAESAKKLINRNRGMGVHAGGLIISRIPLHDLVPLVKRKDMPQASSWVEGMHGQDLQPVGLIKFDLLVISNLFQIAKCCKLVKERHKLDGICRLPGLGDWSDVKMWRNDPKALEMANRGDLKCIFQFDSDGIRKMVQMGGVDSFDDLVAYSSLYRPGPMAAKAHERYAFRKKGIEKYEIPPLLEEVLRPTYGLMIYQEQCMKVLHLVGDIPLKDCEILRKAISKKDEEKFKKYKEMFIVNGMKNLGWNESEVQEFYAMVEAFSGYSFNKSHSCAYCYISQQLLYLKSHFPDEFYAAVLSCETLSEKIKEYKLEAKAHGVELHRLDINKSDLTFSLVENDIYYGMSNIKGIGEEPAKAIVAGKPYKGFDDFLDRFGTESKVLKPLIGLGCFAKEGEPVTLWKFTDFYKDKQKKYNDKKKRFVSNLIKYQKEFEVLTGTTMRLDSFSGRNPFAGEDFKKYDVPGEKEVNKSIECGPDEGGEEKLITTYVSIDGADIEKIEKKYYKMGKVIRKFNVLKLLVALWNRYRKAIDADRKNTLSLPRLIDFDPNSWPIEDGVIKELRDPIKCEEKYYGFAWVHDLEHSPDYKGGMTFEKFRSNPDFKAAPVEIKVLKVYRKEGKKSPFYQVECEDVANEFAKFNVWMDDWERWEPELKKGNLLRVRLAPPSGGYPTYTFESPLRHLRWKMIPKNKEDDFRLVVMRPGKKIMEELTHEEVMEEIFQEPK